MIKIWLGQIQTCRNCGTSGISQQGAPTRPVLTTGRSDNQNDVAYTTQLNTYSQGLPQFHGEQPTPANRQPTATTPATTSTPSAAPTHPPQHQYHPPHRISAGRRGTRLEAHRPTKPNKPAPQPPAKNLMDSSGDENPPKVQRPPQKTKLCVAHSMTGQFSVLKRLNSLPADDDSSGDSTISWSSVGSNIHYQDHHLKSLVRNEAKFDHRPTTPTAILSKLIFFIIVSSSAT